MQTGTNHPTTSHEATTERATELQGHKILLAMLQHGPLTAAEAGWLTGMNTNIAGARYLELRGERAGWPALIERTEEKRPPAWAAIPSSRRGVVHRLTAEGVEVAERLAER